MDQARPRREGSPSPPAEHHISEAQARAERIQRIRREIEAGTYETPEKLDAALERMFGVLLES